MKIHSSVEPEDIETSIEYLTRRTLSVQLVTYLVGMGMSVHEAKRMVSVISGIKL